MADEEKEPSFIERAFLKNEINKVKPKSVKLKGAEHIYSPTMQDIIPKIGDDTVAAIQWIAGQRAAGLDSVEKIDDYVSNAKKPKTVNAIDKITASNKELMSKPLSTENQRALIANTMAEVQLPRDYIDDIEMDLKNNPHLSEKEIKERIEKAIERFQKDQKPLNNLEATRPDAGTLGHSLDTAKIFGQLLHKVHPDMTEAEIAKKVDDATLHDYGKGAVRNRDLISKAYGALFNETKKPEIKNHETRGAEMLKSIGRDGAAKYAGSHHSTTDFENELLKAADIYNAMTGTRVYKTTKSPEKALEIMQDSNVNEKHELSQEAFDILKELVENGTIKAPENHESDLYDVYKTKAGNAIEGKGIKLFDVDRSRNYKLEGALRGMQDVQKVIDGIMTGAPLRRLSEYIFSNAKKNAKKNALLELYKDKDPLMYKKLQHNFYNDETIDKIFRDHIDEIIANQKS